MGGIEHSEQGDDMARSEATIQRQYERQEMLGRGGMAVVYRAIQRSYGGFERQVAIKYLLMLVSQPESQVKALLREARLGGMLQHKNIVQTLDVGEENGVPFLVMEYIKGPTLMDVLARCRKQSVPLPLPITLSLMIQVCEGLNYVHSATDLSGNALHLIHRDLKPSNIMLTQDGLAKIADFGVARSTVSQGQTMGTETLQGTPRYMAPEQVEGAGDLDGRTDLFAVGLILYEMLTLQCCYPQPGLTATLLAAARADVQPRIDILPDIPAREAMVAVLRHCLAFDRTARPSTAGALANQLKGIRDELTTQTAGDPTWAQLGILKGKLSATNASMTSTQDAQQLSLQGLWQTWSASYQSKVTGGLRQASVGEAATLLNGAELGEEASKSLTSGELMLDESDPGVAYELERLQPLPSEQAQVEARAVAMDDWKVLTEDSNEQDSVKTKVAPVSDTPDWKNGEAPLTWLSTAPEGEPLQDLTIELFKALVQPEGPAQEGKVKEPMLERAADICVNQSERFDRAKGESLGAGFHGVPRSLTSLKRSPKSNTMASRESTLITRHLPHFCVVYAVFAVYLWGISGEHSPRDEVQAERMARALSPAKSWAAGGEKLSHSSDTTPTPVSSMESGLLRLE